MRYVADASQRVPDMLHRVSGLLHKVLTGVLPILFIMKEEQEAVQKDSGEVSWPQDTSESGGKGFYFGAYSFWLQHISRWRSPP